MCVSTPQYTRRILAPTKCNQAFGAPGGPSSRNGKLPEILVSFHLMYRQARNLAQGRLTRSPYMSSTSRYHLFSWTIMSSLQSPRSISRSVSSSRLKEPYEAQISPQNHAAVHNFLSNVIEEFLVRNSFTKPPQVQPREGSVQNPRKRRRLADHTVSVYSPGISQPSQQSYRAAELDYLPLEQEPLRPGYSESSGSCDGCSSCCEECLHTREGNESDPDLPEDAYYSHCQFDLGEYPPSDEVFDGQVGLDLYLPHECLSGLGWRRSGMDGPNHWRIFRR